MTQRLLTVLGAGGHAKVVVAVARLAGWQVEAVFDDDGRLHGRDVLGVPVRGPLAAAVALGLPAVLAIGSNEARRQAASRLSLQWVALAHPAAVLHDTVTLGAGTVVFAGAVIQPDTSVGAHAIVNTAASIDHDCEVGDFVHIAPGARLAGDVTVEAGAFVGTGAVVAPGVRIGARATLGAGAVAIRDVAPGVVVGGVPARPLRQA